MPSRRCILTAAALLRIATFTAFMALAVLVSAQQKSECTLPDCDQAKAFFTKFQEAVDTDHRKDVAAMVSYPLRSNHNGKATVIKTKAELLKQYDAVFDGGTRCAVKAESVSDVWGNWRGFTVGAGVIWWDRVIPNSAAKSATVQPSDIGKYPFGIITVNHSPETEKSCAGNAKSPVK